MFQSSYREKQESASGRTKHRWIRATLIGALAAVGMSTALAAWAAGPPTAIKMIDMPMGGAFEPAKITIPSGTTVEWKNVGDTVHGATNDPALAAQKSDVSGPAGVKPFDSGFINPGETYTYTFVTPGTYSYVCSPHEMAGMKGQIIVTKQQAHE